MSIYSTAARRFLVIGTLLELGACSGNIGDGPHAKGHVDPDRSDDNGVSAPPPSKAEAAFVCDTGAQPQGPALPKLSRAQYLGMIEVVLEEALGSAAQTVLNDADVTSALNSFPQDARKSESAADVHGGFRRSSQEINESFVQSTYAVATAIGRKMTDPALRGALLGTCGASANSAPMVTACVRDFVARFGRVALRQPLDSASVDFYARIHPASASLNAQAIGEIVATMLAAPDALYRIESGSGEVPGGTNRHWLAPVEFANRLALATWNAPPTRALIEIADDHVDLDDVAVDSMIELAIHDPRFDASLVELAQDWMRVSDLGRLDALNDRPDFRAFAGERPPSSSLHDAMKQEVGDFLTYMVNDARSLQDLLTSPVSFARSKELADFYGVPTWQPGQEPVPADGRPGIFTRAATLVSGHKNSSPILRGVFLRRGLLCTDVPPPPPGVSENLPLVEPDKAETTRQAVERITAQDNGCKACHESFINGLGFALEGFDALGRTRTEEPIFDGMGRTLSVHPIDETAVPRVLADDESPVTGPAELGQRMSESGLPARCLAQSLVQFELFAGATEANYGCLMERVRQRLESGSLRDAFVSLLRSPEFRQRSFTVD